MLEALHLNLDGAWPGGVLGFKELDVREWGPRLRFCARRRDIEAFYRYIEPHLRPFVLYGSGDFHHLTALLLRRLSESFTLIVFDNHPDWDIRPPRWSCGGWVNRALELPRVERVIVWGCGNFELEFPSRVFAPHRRLRTGRLQIRPWAERLRRSTQRRFRCMNKSDWQDVFSGYAQELSGRRVYISIDLDCVESAITNWESGFFTAGELQWAIGQLCKTCRIIGGDICGAYSPPSYASWWQKLAARWDHPKLIPVELDKAIQSNRALLQVLWDALTTNTQGTPGGSPVIAIDAISASR